MGPVEETDVESSILGKKLHLSGMRNKFQSEGWKECKEGTFCMMKSIIPECLMQRECIHIIRVENENKMCYVNICVKLMALYDL